ncbi:MAG: 1-acyl-sn-glycerol-3-phosphate acyltransferase [Bacteroidota bacterium]|nr:1-acyl-sn-glycerol-3-phosphate acyltransferase [Bacteroidota bacterium]
MEETEKKFIDIEKLFRSKNPTLLKWLPRFILRYVKRLLHEDQINDFMRRHKNSDAYEFSAGVPIEMGVTIESTGLENIPPTGRVVIIANHPLGGLDGMSLVPEIAKVRKDISFIVNDLLLNLTNLKEIFVGVNKHGRSATAQMQELDKIFGSEKAVFLFPAGLVSRKIDGKIQDLEWKKTFVTRARKYQSPIVPVYIYGQNRPFFYNLSLWRKRLGIKANIEMILLPDQMYKQKGQKIKFVVGKPITPEELAKHPNDKEAAKWIREQLYSLKSQIK